MSFPGSWQGTVDDPQAHARALMTPGTIDASFTAQPAGVGSMPHPFTRDWAALDSRGRWQSWPDVAWPSGDPNYPTNDPNYLRDYSYALGHDSTLASFVDGDWVAQQVVFDDPYTWEDSSLLHPAYAAMPAGAVDVEFEQGPSSAYIALEVHSYQAVVTVSAPTVPGVPTPFEVIKADGDFADFDLVGTWNHGLTSVPGRLSWDEIGTGWIDTFGTVAPAVFPFTVDAGDKAQLLLVRTTGMDTGDVAVSGITFTRHVTWDNYRYLYDTPQGHGMWSTQQRGTAGGTSGGWPLKHGTTGSWPLSHRNNRF
ncbi:hypothetical protein [Demequina flava]|uniref:hypothetical protein n=1 Tax=Demequina flava TaxID=1095025 RepID=UPI0007827081|nr:hypothetical protein [Demequina flava]